MKVGWHVGGVFLDRLRDADVYVGSRFTTEMADAAEKLKLIHVAGAGTDKVEFEALGPDILVANTFHHEQSIAEYVVAAAVMLRREFLASAISAGARGTCSAPSVVAGRQ
jgi:phosphoglycerate dehydrogenase-like enzyme